MAKGSNVANSVAEHFPAGTLISARYRVVRKLGKGGYGTVYHVEHVELGKSFALKVLTHKEGEGQERIERLRREAITTSKIHHPNIVTVTDFGTTQNGQLYYVMELLEGQTLTRLLGKLRTFSLSRALPILTSICHALHSAHKSGVVHRDLKPGNIFILYQEDAQRGTQQDFVKVLDFGLAMVMELVGQLGRLTADGKTVGTPGYAAPEQLEGREVDHRADIYSLGCIAFEMFAGKPVFSGKAMRVVMDHLKRPPPLVRQRNAFARIPDRMELLIDRCLRKDPGQRFATCAEVLQELREVARTMLTPEGTTWVGAYDARARGAEDTDEWCAETTSKFWLEQLTTGSIEEEREAVLEAMARASSSQLTAVQQMSDTAGTPAAVCASDFPSQFGVDVITGVGQPGAAAPFSSGSKDATGVQQRAMDAEPARPAHVAATGEVRPFRVVVIESDEVLSSEITNVLQDYGYQVQLLSPRGALDALRVDPRSDLVLLSVELLRSSGYTLCNQLKRDPALRHIPVVLMSYDATGDMFGYHRTLDTHADGYLVKPFKRGDLLYEVERLCSDELRPAVRPPSEASSSKLVFLEAKRPSPAARDGFSGSALRKIIIGLSLLTAAVLGLTVYLQLRHDAMASLAIEVLPAKARVLLDGQPLPGQGSLRVVNRLPVGRVKIQVSHPSCSAETRELSLKNGETAAVRINLSCERQ